MEDCQFRKRWEDGDWLLGLLFKTGNTTPPSSYRSVAAFRDQLKLGQFRAAVYAEGLVAAFDEGGAPVLVDCQYGYSVGGTRFHALGADWNLSGTEEPEPRLGKWSDPEFEWSAQSVKIRFCYHFKIGRLCELMGQLLTRKTAPYAAIEVDIKAGHRGQVEVKTRSTAAPSCWLYLAEANGDGSLQVQHRQQLEEFTIKTFDEFVDTPRKEVAPLMSPFVTVANASPGNPAQLGRIS